MELRFEYVREHLNSVFEAPKIFLSITLAYDRKRELLLLQCVVMTFQKEDRRPAKCINVRLLLLSRYRRLW